MADKDNPSELIRGGQVSRFDLWSLPSFDGSDDSVVEVAKPDEANAEPELPAAEGIPVEEVQPITLEELEAIRQDAYNEGLAIGEKDGYHAGQLKAKAENDAYLGEMLQRMERLMQHLFDPIAEQDRDLEKAMVGLVEHISRQVIQRELTMDSSQLSHVVREALKLLPMGAENVRILVNPQDFELVKALRERHDEKWRILEDETMLPGGCRVETEHSRIDATVETRLAQALTQMFEQQREQATQPLPPDTEVDLDMPNAP
ncbi:flagellar assembly protein FliH [Pseudomonas matsuisoli]|uniref:Flagellar assembly protein FliH n=1 Tax=Pseudomonas matsuisoli TaxID=1515666 RepID=A0A917PII3_9PSED|nr:flagellar assembly protein FliH [Pseudomonas matsuisoli]GGJ80387.1 flagellar assembly protein FliH [Pseudomonas matsuisoli]